MKWQTALTKAQLSHMREYQASLSLRSFMVNRKVQKEFDKQLHAAGMGAIACYECNVIEGRLREAGVDLDRIKEQLS